MEETAEHNARRAWLPRLILELIVGFVVRSRMAAAVILFIYALWEFFAAHQ